MLTDEQIDSADMQSLSWMAPRGKDSVREFARAIEAATTAPLLAEIERLKATLAASCDDEREQLWEACPGGGCSRALDAERRLAELESQASNAQAEPLVLERLSISEAKTIVSQHVEGEMTGDDWTIINAVQSAIAAKNGAKLK